MATWIGLGDNTELFWAVLSHRVPRGREEVGAPVRKEQGEPSGRSEVGEGVGGGVIKVGVRLTCGSR
jgi:hypothetical protein